MALLVVVTVPQVSFAARSDNAGLVDRLKGDSSQFCVMIDRRSGNFDAKINEAVQKLQTRRVDHLAQKNTKRAERDIRKSSHRDQVNGRHGARFAKLDDKAVTEEQKAAVVEFKASVNNAIDTRRTAIDSVIQDFRSEMDSLNTAQKSKIDAAVTDFNTARKAAITKAKASCASGVADAVVKSTFDSDMQAAKDAFKMAKGSLEKKDVETIISARKNAIDVAITNFKNAMTAAQDKLKQAFPKIQ